MPEDAVALVMLMLGVEELPPPLRGSSGSTS